MKCSDMLKIICWLELVQVKLWEVLFNLLLISFIFRNFVQNLNLSCWHLILYCDFNILNIYFARSVLHGTGTKSPIQHHQRNCTDSPSVHHGSVGVLAAARIRRESFTWNHGSLVLLCVSVGCGWTHAKDIWRSALVKWVFLKAGISRRFPWR